MLEIRIRKATVWNATGLAWAIILVMEVFDIASRLPPTRAEWTLLAALLALVFESIQLGIYAKAELLANLDKKEQEV